MAMGLQVIEAAVVAKAGKTMEEIIEIVHSNIAKVRFYFVPAFLHYLMKGGRIGGASALIGSLLQIRPILYVNDGMTDILEKVRGTRTALKRIFHIVNEDAQKYGLKHLIVAHINHSTKAKELANRLSEQHNREVPISSIGPVIGLHVGPGTIGVIYCTEK